MQDAAGQGFGLVGAAPDATIYMYKVFSCAEVRLIWPSRSFVY